MDDLGRHLSLFMSTNDSLVDERNDYRRLLALALTELPPSVLRVTIVEALSAWLKRHDVYRDHGPRICPGCELSWESRTVPLEPDHGQESDDLIACVVKNVFGHATLAQTEEP